jgi:SAM-dependent methyltransferase
MARMVGPEGRVVCVDVQPKMLDVLRRRAAKAGLAGRIETHVSTANAIGLHGWDNRFDFALAFTMLHEVGDPANFLREIISNPGPPAAYQAGQPRGRVTSTVLRSKKKGFVTRPPPSPPMRSSGQAVISHAYPHLVPGCYSANTLKTLISVWTYARR